MFVFWYCHKRGREVRLAKEAEEDGGGEVLEVEVSDDEEAEELEEELEKVVEDLDEGDDEKAETLDKSDTVEEGLPQQEEKGAEMEAEKTVGV